MAARGKPGGQMTRPYFRPRIGANRWHPDLHNIVLATHLVVFIRSGTREIKVVYGRPGLMQDLAGHCGHKFTAPTWLVRDVRLD